MTEELAAFLNGKRMSTLSLNDLDVHYALFYDQT